MDLKNTFSKEQGKPGKGHIIKFMAVIFVTVFVTTVLANILFPMAAHTMNLDSVDDKRTQFISLKDSIMGQMLSEEKYRCCLEKPCIYCIIKTPKHGEGAECSCLEDIVNGVHPCGECIGEIMEGHGNKYLASYFATAIAEEMGPEHLPALKQMMLEKYSIPIEEQV